jgi:hypothetical protein
MLMVGRADDYRPLSWKGLQTPSGRNATLTCRNGHTCALTQHTIAPDGTVSPSLVCPELGCGFHEWVRLEGWQT